MGFRLGCGDALATGRGVALGLGVGVGVGVGVGGGVTAFATGWTETHLTLPRHPDARVVPRGEEALQLGRRELRVGPHVVAVAPALEAPQRPDDAHARDAEPGRGSRIGGGGEAGQDPGMVAVRHRDRDRQVRPAQVRDRGSEGRVEAPATGELISAVDVSSKPGRPARRIDPVRHRDRVAVVGAHVVEVALLATTSSGRSRRSAMLRMIWTSAAVHHSQVFWVVNTPDAVEVDPAGPAGQRVDVRGGQRAEHAERDDGEDDGERQAGTRAAAADLG